jgi:AcrR family transcriptional regulator
LVKSLRAEHAHATRTALVQAGRELFSTEGFAQVSAEEIVARARVTRGALYHHFKDKKDLFCAVLDEVAAELTAKVAEAADGQPDAWSGLLAGVDAFLDACVEGDFHRVVILDGPSVLGWQEWREGEGAHALGLLTMGLRLVMDAGIVDEQPVDLLAPLVLGALNEAAMHIAHADDQRAAREEAGRTVHRLLEGLRRDRGR